MVSFNFFVNIQVSCGFSQKDTIAENPNVSKSSYFWYPILAENWSVKWYRVETFKPVADELPMSVYNSEPVTSKLA